MTTSVELSETAQTRTTRFAAAAFVLAPLVTISLFLAAGEAGYERTIFVWTHVGSLVAGILLAVGVTALLYARGARSLGLAGLLGAAFAWVGVGATALWVPIAWEATVFAQTDSSSLGTFTALFSPLGSGYFVAVMFLFGLAVAGVGAGLFGTDAAGQIASGLAAAVSAVAAVWMLYTLASAMPEPITDLTILLTIGLWAVLLPLGVSLFRHGSTTMATGIGSDSRPSGDD